MDLKSGYPFWAVKNGLMHAFPRMQSDLQCDVAVVGGGISGALIADELVAHGHEVVIIEQRDIAWGSSAASTALLQYEIDTPMSELCERYGEASAALAYRSCAQAIGMLGTLADALGDVDYARARSIYFASRQRHVQAMRDELVLRRKHHLDAAWLDADALLENHGIRAPGAIVTDLAARVDPYRMTYRLCERLESQGTRVFDRTRIERIDCSRRGTLLTTDTGLKIRAAHTIMAAGYASQNWLDQRVASNHSSYAFITDPVDPDMLGSLSDSLVWESARPYLYVRATGDGRVLVGGEDDATDRPARRDTRVDRKAARLVRKLARVMPALELKPAFAWAGTFAETADGLPFFGPHVQYGPRLHFAMAYGGNGITYSMLGAGLLRALIERRSHPLAELFSFRRLADSGIPNAVH